MSNGDDHTNLHKTLRIDDRGDARWMIIDRPQRANALDFATLEAIVAELERAAREGVPVCVIGGAGTRFSAGFDLHALTGTAQDAAADDAIGRTVDAIAGAPMPVIAAVNGPCIGAAVEVARACDVVVCSPEASFAIPATRLGLLYRPVALARLHRRLGGSPARFLLISGERIDAHHAQQMSLADIVVSRPLDDAVGELAAGMARSAPAATAATKALFVMLDEGADDLTHFEALRRSLLASPERHAALASQRTTITAPEVHE